MLRLFRFIFITGLLVFSFKSFAQGEITLGYVPGVYKPVTNSGFNTFGNGINLLFTKTQEGGNSIPFFKKTDGTDLILKNGLIFQQVGLSYFKTNFSENDYSSISMPINIGGGVNIISDSSSSSLHLGPVLGFEAIYPIVKHSQDPLHGAFNAGVFARFGFSKRLNVFTSFKYGRMIGTSSIRSYLRTELQLGYRISKSE